MVVLPLDTCARLKVAGVAERVKFGAALTARLIVVELVMEPATPVIVMVAVPVVAEPVAESVKLLLEVAPLGLNDALTPLGRPVAVKFTVPAKPPEGVTVIVAEPLLPWATVKLLGEAAKEKP